MTAKEYLEKLNYSKFLGAADLRDLLTKRDFLGVEKKEGGYILTLTPDSKDIFTLDTTTLELRHILSDDRRIDERAAIISTILSDMVKKIMEDVFTPIRAYTLQEVADLLRVSRQTIYNYVTTKRLKATKLAKEYRVYEKDLKEFMKNGTN